MTDPLTARVSTSVGAKVNRGNYQSQDTHVSFSVDIELLPGEDPLPRLEELQIRLDAAAKRHAARNLGLPLSEEDTTQLMFPPGRHDDGGGYE